MHNLYYHFKFTYITFTGTSILDNGWATLLFISLHHLPLLPKITIQNWTTGANWHVGLCGLGLYVFAPCFPPCLIKESDCKIVFPGPAKENGLQNILYIPRAKSFLSKTKYLFLPLGLFLLLAKHFLLFPHLSTISRNMITNP